jgi:hypothetical protein
MTDVLNKKEQFIGSPNDRATSNLNGANIIDAKKAVFHYALFAHQHSNGWSGQTNKISGNTLVVTLGASPGTSIYATDPATGHVVGNSDQQAGTFMHELGHALGLRHGGFENGPNFKSNYLSLMNYAFQFSTLNPSRPINYDVCNLKPSLDENSLNEEVGIGKTTNSQGCTSGPFYGIINGAALSGGCTLGIEVIKVGAPVDWNKNGVIEPSISKDLNCDHIRSILTPNDDWHVMDLTKALSETGGLGPSSAEEEITELTSDEVAGQLIFLANDALANIQNITVNTTSPEAGASPGISADLSRLKESLSMSIGTIEEGTVNASADIGGLITDLRDETAGVGNQTQLLQLIASGKLTEAAESVRDKKEQLSGFTGGFAPGTFVGDEAALQKLDNLESALSRQLWDGDDATAGLPPGSTAIPAMLPEPIPFEFTDPNNPDAAGFVLKTADTGLARTVAKAIALYNLDQGGALSGTVTATETGGFGTIGDSFDRFIDTVGNEADKAINRAVKAWQVIRGNSETAGIGDEAAGFGISLGAFGFNVGFQCC